MLIFDSKNNKDWILTSIPSAAHAQFDFDDPGVIYFSNHNTRFIRPPAKHLLRRATYGLDFFAPASVHKYRLGQEGPREIGVFSDPRLFGMTNCYVFQCAGRKILAASGDPNFIFVADAENMKLIKRIEIKNPEGPCYIGTFAPFLDGQKLFIHTTKSFQIVDLASGQPDFISISKFFHYCRNHMLVSNDTDW